MIQLSVNVNKVAVLRNSRGGSEPDPVTAAQAALAAGCHGITVHPRPDQRHIRVDDVARIAQVLDGAEYNIEGNPFAPARGDYPGLLAIVRAARPAQVTLVPDGDGQITSDHGFDVERDVERLTPLVEAFRGLGCRVSVFIDAGTTQLKALAAIGVDRVEIYTGPFAHAHVLGDDATAVAACVATAQAARTAGLGVNAGHDLSQHNLARLADAIPWLDEVSIGHALFGEALYAGLAATVHAYLDILRAPAAPD